MNQASSYDLSRDTAGFKQLMMELGVVSSAQGLVMQKCPAFSW